MNEQNERVAAVLDGLAAAIRDPECPVQFSPVLMEARKLLSAALPPLRAREEKPWAFDQACCDAIKDWLREEAPIGARETVHSGHIFWLMTRLKAALSRTAGQEWRGISSAPKDGTPIDLWADNRRWADCRWGRFDEGSVRPFGEPHWRGLNSKEQPSHWMPLPAPPVAEPIVAEKQTP